MRHILNNGWEDKEFLAQRVYGMDQVRTEVEKYPPEEVERISGSVSGEQLNTRRREVREGKARNPDLVHGPDAEDRRHGQRARVLHRGCC